MESLVMCKIIMGILGLFILIIALIFCGDLPRKPMGEWDTNAITARIRAEKRIAIIVLVGGLLTVFAFLL